MRLVRTPEGSVLLDPRGKVSGRGAYLCGREACFSSRRARESIGRALQVTVSEDDWMALLAELQSLAQKRAAELAREDD